MLLSSSESTLFLFLTCIVVLERWRKNLNSNETEKISERGFKVQICRLLDAGLIPPWFFSSNVQQLPVPALNYVLKSPIGVAGMISPWNLPLYLLSFKLAPALAAGNTVVAKPSEFTSVTAWLLAHAVVEAGSINLWLQIWNQQGWCSGLAFRFCNPQSHLFKSDCTIS